MATLPTSPVPPAMGQPPAAGGAAPQPQTSQPGGTAQKLARLAMDAQSIASDAPETAPMMREIQNQVRQATMKMIQQRQAQQQATPQI